jgi:hypothetical protein
MLRTITILLLASVSFYAQSQEAFQLMPQNAGDLIHEESEFAVHYNTNWVPDHKYYSGPSHCLKKKIPGFEDHFTTRVIVVAKKGRAFNFTRQWLWETLRPAMVGTVVPMICPDADIITFNLYIDGLDIAVSGDAYQTHDVRLPVVQRPPAAEFSTLKADFMNGISYIPGFVFNRELSNFVSGGIVAAAFPNKDYCASFGESNCTFNKFFPSYRAHFWSRNAALQRKAIEGDEQALEEMKRYHGEVDPNANFDYLSTQIKLEYKQAAARQVLRDEHAARTAHYASFWRGIDEAIAEHGFWKLFAAGLLGGNGKCQPSNSPLCSADYQAVQNAPLLFK